MVGLAAPFGKWNAIRDHAGTYEEMILLRAFKRTIEQRGTKVPLHALHESRKLPLGPVTRMTEEADDFIRAVMGDMMDTQQSVPAL